MVAVKIIEYTQEPGQKDPLEGLLSEQVHHPVSSRSPAGASSKALEAPQLSHRTWACR